MEQVADKLISELDDLKDSAYFESNYFMDTPTKFGDPGIVLNTEYPYLFVQPGNDDPKSETMGTRGYDVRVLSLIVGVVIDVSDYFDPEVEEVPGQREVVQIMTIIKRHLQKKAKRQLDGLEGVRNVLVGSVEYRPDVRDPAFVMMGLLTVTVEKQYQREVD